MSDSMGPFFIARITKLSRGTPRVKLLRKSGKGYTANIEEAASFATEKDASDAMPLEGGLFIYPRHIVEPRLDAQDFGGHEARETAFGHEQ